MVMNKMGVEEGEGEKKQNYLAHLGKKNEANKYSNISTDLYRCGGKKVEEVSGEDVPSNAYITSATVASFYITDLHRAPTATESQRRAISNCARMDIDYCDIDKVTDPEVRKIVLAHRNSRCPDPGLTVDANLFARRLSSDFRADAAQGAGWMGGAKEGEPPAKNDGKAAEKK